jgi:hypothetical protein
MFHSSISEQVISHLSPFPNKFIINEETQNSSKNRGKEGKTMKEAEGNTEGE